MPLVSYSFCLVKHKLILANRRQLGGKRGLHPEKVKVSATQYFALCTVIYSVRESHLHPLSMDYATAQDANGRRSGPNAKTHFKKKLSEKLMALQFQDKLKEAWRLLQAAPQP